MLYTGDALANGLMVLSTDMSTDVGNKIRALRGILAS